MKLNLFFFTRNILFQSVALADWLFKPWSNRLYFHSQVQVIQMWDSVDAKA